MNEFAKELAGRLNGRQYLCEMTREDETFAKEHGLIVLFGYSDDNVEIRGAFNEEVDAYDGTTILLTKDGILEDPACCKRDCPYYKMAAKSAKSIDAIWNGGDGYPWTFKTDLPHETFEIFEDDYKICRGIIVSTDDL